MPDHLCLTITFLDRRFHGRVDAGQLEWPPSPLRLYQAIVAASAAASGRLDSMEPALRWFEQMMQTNPPLIVAPATRAGEPYRLSVPNNAMDLVARAWAKGNYEGSGDASPATHRTMKTVRCTHLLDGDQVHYLWELPQEMPGDNRRYFDSIRLVVRGVVALGWGIDLAIGHGQFLSTQQVNELSGERWIPARGRTDGISLRVPCQGTLDDLIHRHQAFLKRVRRNERGEDMFVPVPPLGDFALVRYRRAMDVESPPFAAFALVSPSSGERVSFDLARSATVVAGMIRHALTQVALAQKPFGWDEATIVEIVQGHSIDGRPARLQPDGQRFAYLPLPTLERRKNRGVMRTEHVGTIAHVLVAGRLGMEREIAWVRQALSGAALLDEASRQVKSLLSPIPPDHWLVQRYTEPGSVWTTVTPVIVPGYDDRKPSKTDRLIRKALRQAGFPADLTDHAEIEWRGVGFLPGVDIASRYRRPLNVSEAPVRHVRIRWRNRHGQPIPIAGPVAIGSGRFRGLGLFASMNPQP